MNIKPPSRLADQFVVRLPEGMRDRIAELAKQSGRSMNSEIVARLEESLTNTSNPNLVAALARTTVGAALANAEKLSEQLRTTILATHVRRLGEQLLPLLEQSDAIAAAEVKAAMREANEFFHSPRALQTEAAEKAATMRKALTHFERLGGVDESNPELSGMLEALQQLDQAPLTKGSTADVYQQALDGLVDAGAVSVMSSGEVETVPPEPPRRPGRIVRKKSES